MTRTNRGGSMLSFVVVAIIMAGVLIGGVYTVHRLTTQSNIALRPESRQPQDQSSLKNNQHQNDNQTPKTTVSTPSDATVGQASQLPQTGTEDVFGSVIALGFISVTLVSYVRSRRPELSL